MQYLEDNETLIKSALQLLNQGRAAEAAKLQTLLQRNLMWLASIADSQAQPPQPAPAEPSSQVCLQYHICHTYCVTTLSHLFVHIHNHAALLLQGPFRPAGIVPPPSCFKDAWLRQLSYFTETVSPHAAGSCACAAPAAGAASGWSPGRAGSSGSRSARISGASHVWAATWGAALLNSVMCASCGIARGADERVGGQPQS